jgi:hypothetical protein
MVILAATRVVCGPDTVEALDGPRSFIWLFRPCQSRARVPTGQGRCHHVTSLHFRIMRSIFRPNRLHNGLLDGLSDS